jgi:hypothetical protein
MMMLAASDDPGATGSTFGRLSCPQLPQTDDRQLRIRHRARRRREGPYAVARAIRPGHLKARTPAGWLDDVVQHPAMLLRRVDTQRRILALCRVLANWAKWPQPWLGDEDWERMLTRPTWQVLQRETGLGRSTVASHLAWLQSVGLLGLVAHGTTPDLSPAILRLGGRIGADDESRRSGRNEAAVYVLIAPTKLRLVAVDHPDDLGAEYVHDGRDLPTDPSTGAVRSDVAIDLSTGELIPAGDEPGGGHGAESRQAESRPPGRRSAVDQTWTPTTPRRGDVTPSHARVREDHSGAGLRPAQQHPHPVAKEAKRNIPDQPAETLRAKPAGTKTARLAASTALQAVLPLLRRISTAHVAHFTREFWLAGWSPVELLDALGRRPDGSPWRHDEEIRHVPGWMRHRLAAWRHDPADPCSPVRRPPSEAAAALAAAQVQARTARRSQARALASEACGAERVRALAEAARAAHRAALASSSRGPQRSDPTA